MSDISVELPTKQEFAENVDSNFHAHLEGGNNFDFLLTQIDEIVSNEVQENFTLLFQAPAIAPPSQGIYRLEHDVLGAMELFLVPVSRDADGLYYEAVFNLLVKS